MTFNELNKIMEEKFGPMRLADIAREFDVTPQVVSNWKSRDQVPYKYVIILRKKSEEIENTESTQGLNPNLLDYSFRSKETEDNFETLKTIGFVYNALNKNKALFIIIPFILIIYTIVNLLFFVDPIYTSRTRILPAIDNRKGQMSGFAAQFGINVGPSPSDFSAAELYPDVVKSRILLKILLNRRFDSNRFGKAQPLLNILVDSEGKSSKSELDILVYKGINKLKKIIEIRSSRKTPLIDITVNVFEPKLAKDIVEAIIEELDNLQNNFKISRIKEKRIFIENRITELDIDLSTAEELLKKFREENRNISSSPSLLLEESRYQRELAVLTQLYITLKNEYEQMQIEEVEDSRMFVVLDEPDVPLKKTGPNRRKIVLTTCFLSLLFSLGIVITKDWIDQNWNKKIRPLLKSV